MCRGSQMLNLNLFFKLNKLNNLIVLNIGLILAVIFSGIAPISAHAQQPDTDHISIIFVLDDSGSMGSNDPSNLRVTAVKLFIAMLDPGDGAAVIT